jgi:hypothetical protein
MAGRLPQQLPYCYECLVISILVIPCFHLFKNHHKYTIGDGLAAVVAGDSLFVMPVSASEATASIPVTRRHLISRGSWVSASCCCLSTRRLWEPRAQPDDLRSSFYVIW